MSDTGIADWALYCIGIFIGMPLGAFATLAFMILKGYINLHDE